MGGVSERAGVRAQEEQSSGDKHSVKTNPSRVVAAKGIPVFWKAARFAVCRWNEGLGRLVLVQAASSAGIERAGDSGCPKAAKEGNAVVLRHHKRRNRMQARDTVACRSGRVLHSVLRPVLVDPHYAPTGQLGGGGAPLKISRLGKPG